MKKLLATDNSLRIISLFTAIAIWIYISIVMDPPIQVTVRDLPIQFVGQETLSNKGLAIINENATTVTVKVKGSRKKMGNNDMKTIIAKADISNISEIGTHSIPVEIIVPFENQGIDSQSIYTVDVSVEKQLQKTFDVEIKTEGTLAENYINGTMTLNPERITVTGAKSAVEKISKAFVTMKFSGEDVDIDKALSIGFSDESGKNISGLDAIMTRIDTDAEKIAVHCPVLKVVEVAVIPNFGYDEPDGNFKYKINPSAIHIYGDDQKIYTMTEIKTEWISLTELKEREKLKVELEIPHGVKVIDDIFEVEISAN